MEQQITVLQKEEQFGSPATFEHAQRVAKMLSSSSLIPKEYQGNIQNTMIAIEMANRIGANPLMVMQNLYIVHGRPSWSSSFIIAALNACKRFSPLRFVMSGEGEDYGCTAWAYDVDTKDKLEGPKVTLKMANAEGWVSKSGSKWKTMPELMFRYRAAAFFGRLYAPDILMGIYTADEMEDIQPVTIVESKINKEEERVKLMIEDATSVEDLEKIKENVMPSQLDLFNEKLATLSTGK
ncbi:recombinase RecT [Terrimonas rubra]|uniref:Recombinase RecT n=1 Tax=Terrimonas rubra TaxID=1035890 RepID=A0ABW6A9R4_9BACT